MEIAAAADHRHQLQNFFQRDTFAAEQIAMPHLSALHSQHQPCREIADVHEIHHEIEVEVKTTADKKRCSIAVGGVRWCSCGPIGMVGVPMITGKPDAAASYPASCSASIFERVY